ncbi:peroxiredoxin [Gammaproteobacteria bacterium]|nr:peroxiredoxin [Gammaproteobacteria bacterium]
MSQLIGYQAPDFSLTGVDEKGQFKEYQLAQFKGQYVVLFFYPMDFTFVCPLELIKLNQMIEKFKAKNCQVFGISLDSEHTHLAWRSTDTAQGGIGALNFPLLADVSREVTQAYQAMNTQSPRVPMRATIIIDPEGIVRIAHSNDLPIGRSPSEILRLIEALQHHEAHGEVCPPEWQTGEKSLEPSKAGLNQYIAETAES